MRKLAPLIVRAMCGLMVCGASTWAAEPATIAIGSRVRVTTLETGARLIATVLSLEPGAVTLRGESSETPTRVLVSPSTRFELSAGQKSKAGRGAMIGGALGVMPGLFMTFGDYNTDKGSPAAVALLGAAAGAGLGAAIGWTLKSEKWESAQAPAVTAGIAPLRRGFAISFNVAWGQGGHR